MEKPLPECSFQKINLDCDNMEETLFGVLNVYKPKGMTSHDVVAILRRTLHMKRIGHTGTLDPVAEGVLPILIGKATKLSDLLMAEEKRYKAGVKLGITTDTDDVTGEILEQKDVSIKEEDVQKVLMSFLGKQAQIPPMYSAIKVDGKKLYELARRGVVTERKPRDIEIYDLKIENFNGNTFDLTVHCSKGTYIRALCRDIGAALQTGAAMETLLRLQSGNFSLENTHTLEEIKEAAENGTVETFLISPEDVLKEFPRVDVNDEFAAKVKNGIRLRPEQLGISGAEENNLYCIYFEDTLLCVLKAVAGENTLLLAMEKSFY